MIVKISKNLVPSLGGHFNHIGPYFDVKLKVRLSKVNNFHTWLESGPIRVKASAWALNRKIKNTSK